EFPCQLIHSKLDQTLLLWSLLITFTSPIPRFRSQARDRRLQPPPPSLAPPRRQALRTLDPRSPALAWRATMATLSPCCGATHRARRSRARAFPSSRPDEPSPLRRSLRDCERRVRGAEATGSPPPRREARHQKPLRRQSRAGVATIAPVTTSLFC